MLSVLQKRSIYRYKFDKNKFISDASAEINRLMKKKSDYALFEIEESNVDFNEARRMKMTSAQKRTEESEILADEYEPKSTFEIANYIMSNTMLPRLAIFKIIDKLDNESRKRFNKQNYLDDALKHLKDMLIKYKSKDFIKAEVVPGISASEKNIFAIDKISNDADVKHLFIPNSSRKKALNLKYSLDSDGEVIFAKELDKDPNVKLYTKLKKGRYVIETPAGKYSPDWAIVYEEKDAVSMYFIAENQNMINCHCSI